jgi:acyl-CoA synthetase (NDP forming)/RimJ/RimL family protein N-acetyltransferase
MSQSDAPEPGDLREWEFDAVLADGSTAHVRPIRPDDGDRLVDLHARMSDRSRYFRFFSPKPRLTDKEVERFTHVDFNDRVALVAVLGDQIIAVARYDRWPGKDEAEVAFTVDDAHQGKGIATLLLEHLSVVARQRGIGRFTAEVLPDNNAMLGVFRRAGFEVHRHFASGVVDVAFDIDPTPAFIETVEQREQRAESRSIARILHPKSIAVVGASDRAGSMGRAVFRNLLAHGFDGPVYPVNPFVPHVASVPAVPAIGDIADDVHLAIIAVPAAEVADLVAQCAAKRVRGAVVIATGFSDAGESGADEERRLIELARLHGMRLIGPASMGFISTTGPGVVHASFTPVAVQPGRVALSLQSGPLGSALLEMAGRLGLGISTFVSLGNKGDVSANDLLNYWDDDPGTDVVLMYTESFGNPRKFGRIARRVSRRKPIVAVKVGRSDRDDVAADALYQQAGVIRVDSVRELLDVGRLLASQPLPAGPRVAVVSNAASPAALAADAITGEGLVMATLADATSTSLAAVAHDEARTTNPVDLTYRAGAQQIAAALGEVLADPGVDAVVTVYTPPVVGEVVEVGEAITRVAAHADKPVVAVLLGQEEGPAADGGSVPSFAFPEPAAAALARAVRYARWRSTPQGTVPPEDAEAVESSRAIVTHALGVRPEGTLLPLSVARELFRVWGLSFAPARAVTSVGEAVAAADELGYPVTVKAAGLERLARSESGGVALDLQSSFEVAAAYERMRAALGTAMAEAMVQKMVPGGVETVAAVEQHPSFGPVVTFGLGGAFADAIDDHTARSLPLTDLDALAMVRDSRAAAAVAAVGANPEAIAAFLVRVAAMADALPEIDRVRINPVIVSRSEVWGVDAKVHVAPADVRPDVLLRRME